MFAQLFFQLLVRLGGTKEGAKTQWQRVEPLLDVHALGLFELDYTGYRRRHPVPIRGLFFELLPPEARQRIKAGAAIILARLPLRRNPSPSLQFVKCGIEG